MYAIVDIAGQQFKVEKDQKIFVHRLEGEEGSKVDFDQIFLVENNGKVTVGTPVVKDMVVSASILSHVKSDKVLVFKKKRRKGYQKMNGHRQSMTEILIENIGAGKARPASVKTVETKKQVEAEQVAVAETATKVAEVKKTEKTTSKVSPKKAAPKTTAKPAAKTTAKKPAAAKPKASAVKKEAKPAPKPKAAAKPKKSEDK
jgi:large subunit ribosomal protein L21